MQVKVEATSKEATKTAKGEYTGIKYAGKWVNVWGNHVGTKGQTLDITTPEQFKQKDGTLSKTYWAKEIEDKPEPEEHNGNAKMTAPESSNPPTDPSHKRGFYDVSGKFTFLVGEIARIFPTPEALAAVMPGLSNTLRDQINSYMDGKTFDDSGAEITEEGAPF